jgi:hypothetical protein
LQQLLSASGKSPEAASHLHSRLPSRRVSIPPIPA